MLIYKATNRINGKVYVGQTTSDNLRIRIGRHMSYGTQYFPRALRQYGIESFTFEIIDRASTQPELNAKEKQWIAALNSMCPNGYNLTAGGFGTSGWKASDEVRAKVSAAKRGKSVMTKSGRQRLREYQTGRKWSPEARAKMSASRKGRILNLSDETRALKSLAMVGNRFFLGRKHKPETIEKMRAAQKGRIITPEARQKLRIANLGKRASMETRQKMSLSQLVRYAA